jgi:hypothetical protein
MDDNTFSFKSDIIAWLMTTPDFTFRLDDNIEIIIWLNDTVKLMISYGCMVPFFLRFGVTNWQDNSIRCYHLAGMFSSGWILRLIFLGNVMPSFCIIVCIYKQVTVQHTKFIFFMLQ